MFISRTVSVASASGRRAAHSALNVDLAPLGQRDHRQRKRSIGLWVREAEAMAADTGVPTVVDDDLTLLACTSDVSNTPENQDAANVISVVCCHFFAFV